MPTYPVMFCRKCNASVQLESNTKLGDAFPKLSLRVLYSNGLDSDDYSNYCRGQGKFYSLRRTDLYALPSSGSHFNFSGVYAGLCCYCALGEGYSYFSFDGVGCYHSKMKYLVVKEFSRLKHQRSANGQAPSWENCTWGGLSDSLVDLILKMAVGETVKLIQ